MRNYLHSCAFLLSIAVNCSICWFYLLCLIRRKWFYQVACDNFVNACGIWYTFNRICFFFCVTNQICFYKIFFLSFFSCCLPVLLLQNVYSHSTKPIEMIRNFNQTKDYWFQFTFVYFNFFLNLYKFACDFKFCFFFSQFSNDFVRCSENYMNRY